MVVVMMMVEMASCLLSLSASTFQLLPQAPSSGCCLQLTAAALPCLGQVLMEDHSQLHHINLAGNLLPTAHQAATMLLAVLKQELASTRRFTINLQTACNSTGMPVRVGAAAAIPATPGTTWWLLDDVFVWGSPDQGTVKCPAAKPGRSGSMAVRERQPWPLSVALAAGRQELGQDADRAAVAAADRAAQHRAGTASNNVHLDEPQVPVAQQQQGVACLLGLPPAQTSAELSQQADMLLGKKALPPYDEKCHIAADNTQQQHNRSQTGSAPWEVARKKASSSSAAKQVTWKTLTQQNCVTGSGAGHSHHRKQVQTIATAKSAAQSEMQAQYISEQHNFQCHKQNCRKDATAGTMATFEETAQHCRHSRVCLQELQQQRQQHMEHADKPGASSVDLQLLQGLAQVRGRNPRLAQVRGRNPRLAQVRGRNPRLAQVCGRNPRLAQVRGRNQHKWPADIAFQTSRT
jgi:hypothetical protein